MKKISTTTGVKLRYFKGGAAHSDTGSSEKRFEGKVRKCRTAGQCKPRRTSLGERDSEA